MATRYNITNCPARAILENNWHDYNSILEIMAVCGINTLDTPAAIQDFWNRLFVLQRFAHVLLQGQITHDQINNLLGLTTNIPAKSYKKWLHRIADNTAQEMLHRAARRRVLDASET